ncbi:uncharacterized protein BDR25DRAFT_343379 [Lindgomyces ingoldianus]|uniref:Uncharacterized protein n=1 Tax=Lindgomyces ingoldianus TaxID=673940 RepID=A0ACB6QTG4_9PLEO|nr:uncharacterized protein BDR25DRAFT_343379 [Lindgomyces ingoldianus]KAF2470175.1 hypothetical protein BDR25DRAFT_343379 [Lindgomyces ingoldianus]
MEKHDQPVDEKDEDLIKQGILKADTESIVSSAPSRSEQVEEDAKVPIDDTTFSPTRTFYILRHNLFSTEINLIDISSEIAVNSPYSGGEISNELRDAARELSKDEMRTSNPAYRLKRPHWWNSTCKMSGIAAEELELASWKHPSMSFGKASITFPQNSTHSSHNFIMAPVKWYRRTNEWVQDSVTYSWRCNSKYKANRMTLYKKIGGKNIVVARYAQRWGSWVTGGVLLVDAVEVDEVVAGLTACVMLRRMQQRAAERMKSAGVGGGGGGGGGD